MTSIIIALCFVLILLILALILMAPEKQVVDEGLYPYKLIHPYQSSIDNDLNSYEYSRDVGSRWSKDEALKWFTQPDSLLLDQLESKNSKKIDDILEVAP